MKVRHHRNVTGWRCDSVGVWECDSVGVWECDSVTERWKLTSSRCLARKSHVIVVILPEIHVTT